MFDKMIFIESIDIESEAEQIAELNRLEKWENDQRKKYECNDSAKFTGIYINIRESRVQIKCSLHKYYNKMVNGTLENDGMFTITEARRAIYSLFNEIGVCADRAVITNFEIGLNIPTEYEPIKYIELMTGIKTGKASQNKKEMFIDAYFHKNRQKTTEKRKTIKKVFKVYDKGFEKADRKRTESIDGNILRIETTYKRQYVMVDKFFQQSNIERLTQTFFHDWINVEFERIITADKGLRSSQIINAEQILKLGRYEYLEKINKDLAKGDLTERQHRTIREFIRDWDCNKHKYRMIPTIYETEYRGKIRQLFSIAKR